MLLSADTQLIRDPPSYSVSTLSFNVFALMMIPCPKEELIGVYPKELLERGVID